MPEKQNAQKTILRNKFCFVRLIGKDILKSCLTVARTI